MNTLLYKPMVAVSAALLAMAISNVAGAYPSRGGSCTSCHGSPGGSLTATPDPLDIQVGQSGLLTFSVANLGGSSNTAISVQGLSNPALNASLPPGGNTTWTYRSNATYGNSYVSSIITAIGSYTLNLPIGSLATPGTYPIVVMYAGDGEAATTTGFNLRVMLAGLAGDYNKNGTVDAADYVVWRNGDSPDDTQAGYDVWRSHFGQIAASGSVVSANAAIPEPATVVMLIVGMLLMCSRRRAAVR
jgi:hypothetical protein